MTRSNRTACHRIRRYSTLAIALLAVIALPVFAADLPCTDANGNPVAGNTNQGSEHGDSDTRLIMASTPAYRRCSIWGSLKASHLE